MEVNGDRADAQLCALVVAEGWDTREQLIDMLPEDAQVHVAAPHELDGLRGKLAAGWFDVVVWDPALLADTAPGPRVMVAA